MVVKKSDTAQIRREDQATIQAVMERNEILFLNIKTHQFPVWLLCNKMRCGSVVMNKIKIKQKLNEIFIKRYCDEKWLTIIAMKNIFRNHKFVAPYQF